MAKQVRSLLAAAAILTASPAHADAVSDFYKGKMLTIITWQGPGTSYDAYARLLGRYMGKFIPGEPTFRVQLLLGGGGIIATNHVATIAPKDGTILYMVGPGSINEQAMGLNKALIADHRTFGWLGGLSASNQTLVTWHTSPTKTLEMAKQRETTVGATAVGSVSYQLPAFYNAVLGTKLKIVSGYAEASIIEAAMERGEVEGRGTNPWATYKSLRPDWVSKKMILPILQVGLKKERDLPDVPLLMDLAKDDGNREAIGFISRSSAIGRPVSTTPDVPPERLAALKSAFEKVVRDPEFVAEIHKQKLELEPSSGEEIAAMIKALIEAPAEVRDRVRRATEPPQKP